MNRCDDHESPMTPAASRSVETRKSVVFVTRKWPPAIGGMETYSLRLSEELAKLADVRTIALPGRADGAPPSAARLIWFGITAAVRLLTARRAADVVHIGDLASWPLAVVARLRSGRSRIAVSVHGTDVSYPRRGGFRGSLYAVYLGAAVRLLPRAVLIANSRATADAVRAVGFGRVTVVRLATDVHGEADVSGRHNGALLFAGRLTPLKGCGWFVREVLPLLSSGLSLRIAGTVWDKSEAAALEHPRVTYLGALRSDALYREYASALCVVLPNIEVPSREFEGFGLVAAEAAAAGGVVLAADCGGLSDAVIDGQTGFLLASGDAAAWADKIRKISEWNEETRLVFVHNAMEMARRFYSWDRVARETFAAYRCAG